VQVSHPGGHQSRQLHRDREARDAIILSLPGPQLCLPACGGTGVCLKPDSLDRDFPPSLGTESSPNVTTSELTLSLASVPEALPSTPAIV
jgi:hypothetical protein